MKTKRKEMIILEELSRAAEPLSGNELMQRIGQRGGDLSERTVRLYLQRFDEEGLTEARGRQGRVITDKGRSELRSGKLISRVGSLSATIDRMTYGMKFDLDKRVGSVVINTAFVPIKAFRDRVKEVCEVFRQGYAMGTLVNLLGEGERIGDEEVPAGHVGFCTVCSVTLNGVLLKAGIPTRSVFSGLLELEAGEATRFVEYISYDSTSIDPLQLFIRSRMTDYSGAIRTGNGVIGAGFREIPEQSYPEEVRIAKRVKDAGLGAFMTIGQPSRDLLNIPVREGSCGVIVIGGLNPVAIFEENGVPVTYNALSGFMEYAELFPYTELAARLE